MRHGLLLIALVLLAVEANALDWDIKPGACLVSSDSEFCEANVRIRLSDYQQLPCLHINGRRYACFKASEITVPLKITDDVKFSLINARGEVLAEYLLPYQVIEQRPKRRRVRLPWSVFE